MQFIELLGTAIGLSMDAFAVALCKGLAMPRLNWRHGGLIALFFGAFQALMPLLGWFLGSQFEQYIAPVDHWVAFALLAFIGGKMIWEALHEEEAEPGCEEGINLRQLTLMAFATSVDALAAGITFAFLQVSIVPSVSLIGLVTFALSLVGVYIGHRFGAKLMKKAELAGGGILILIGLKILLEGLGLL
ncbi:MAG: manganese efflux pump MntP family protein [Oscillospiraceae bacterium]|jgi:putative Mn2+ efflux pump MntP|nr:manganese efflux pump MntP family protein [Oscillospiraceae bacterium]